MKQTISILLITILAAAPSLARAQSFSLRDAPLAADVFVLDGESVQGGMFQAETGEVSANEQISKKKAFLYSLLLPGLGHYYAGDKSGAKTFFAIEAAIWTSFIFFEVQGYIREEGYQDYAQVFAGVAGEDKSDDYYSIIGQYNSWIEYEASVKNEGRFALYPDADSQTLEEYFIDNRVSDYEPWTWRSVDERRNFRSQRSDSKRSYRRALYAVAVAAANRAAASFFSLGAANKANERIGGQTVGYGLEIGPPVDHPGDYFETGVSFVATF